MGLPAELRLMIYEPTLCHSQKYPKIHVNAKTGKDRNRRPKPSGLFTVSRQIRGEALSVYYRTNSFVYHVNSFTVAQFQRAVDWLRMTMDGCFDAKQFGSFKLRIHGSVWQDPRAILPLLLFINETGFWPYTPHDYSQYRKAVESQDRRSLVNAAACSMFIMQGPDCVHAQKMLEEAVALARIGWDNRLEADLFAERFEDFVREYTGSGRARAALRQCERRARVRGG